ncbi:riboflavin biosynthesis protein RibD [Endozoicomonas sp. (ex Bugula neritina AB1)]|nr:riboflavin biosynthesis protein RibD [Endozoicomonas sp. (ex Bugula neritina AB1)]
MTEFSAADHQFMAKALQLARKGLYTTMPNPCVGCVIVDAQGWIVGEGWHERAGEPHAEVHALRMAGNRAKGATAYVTLEPCSHYGRTPPCAEGLIKAEISRVVVAVLDSNPAVAGRGVKRLVDAGIQTCHGLMSEEAEQLNKGFFKRMRTGRPFVRAKLAMSLDGRTAMGSGESQWITGPDARSEVQRLRAQSCAIISGVGSILHDDSSLTLRASELNLSHAEALCQQQPLRVVLDSRLETPVNAKVISGSGKCLIVTTNKACPERIHQLQQAGAEVWIQPEASEQVDLPSLLNELGRRECNHVLLETGATLAGSMMSADLIDELVVFVAPVLMGSDARPLMNLPLLTMSEKKSLDIIDIRAVGSDWKITAKPRN